VKDYVDVDSDGEIDVSINTKPAVGTVYTVNVPVRRVKPGLRAGFEYEDADGSITLRMTQDEDEREYSRSQFPYGT